MPARLDNASLPERHDGPTPTDSTFTGQTLTGPVMLDGVQFRRCRFKGAALVYCGGAPPSFEDCSFEGASFRFDGAAGRTLAFLKAMSAPSSGLAPVFRASFPRLFGH